MNITEVEKQLDRYLEETRGLDVKNSLGDRLIESYCREDLIKVIDLYAEEVYSEQSYDEGYDAGSSTGYDDGHNDGYYEGHEAGHEAGYEEGHETGYEEGFEAGKESVDEN